MPGDEEQLANPGGDQEKWRCDAAVSQALAAAVLTEAELVVTTELASATPISNPRLLRCLPVKCPRDPAIE